MPKKSPGIVWPIARAIQNARVLACHARRNHPCDTVEGVYSIGVNVERSCSSNGSKAGPDRVREQERPPCCWPPPQLQCRLHGTTQFALTHQTCKQRGRILVPVLAAAAVPKHDWMMNFFLPMDHFPPTQISFLHIPAHCMYISFGAALEPIGICYSPVRSVIVPAIINVYVVYR